MDRDQMQLKSKWYVQNIERQDELAIEHNQKVEMLNVNLENLKKQLLDDREEAEAEKDRLKAAHQKEIEKVLGQLVQRTIAIETLKANLGKSEKLYQSKCVIELQLAEDVKNAKAGQAELVEAHQKEVAALESKISAHDAIVDKQKAWIQDRDKSIEALSLDMATLRETAEAEKRQKEGAYRRRAELEEQVQALKNENIKENW